jgi:hypothetical protein
MFDPVSIKGTKIYFDANVFLENDQLCIILFCDEL